MQILNPDLLAEMKKTPRCELCCGRPPTEVHHIFRKGMGGGSQLDIPINLLALCRECHDFIHAGTISRDHQLAVAAEREIRKLLRETKP